MQPEGPAQHPQDFFGSLPLGTRIVLSTCIFVAVYVTFFAGDSHSFVLCVQPVVRDNEVWRVFTSNYAHSGIAHLGMNMMSLCAIGKELEGHIGSLTFMGLVFHFSICIGTLYLCACWLFSILQGDEWLVYCSVGFSGVLFALLVVQVCSPWSVHNSSES